MYRNKSKKNIGGIMSSFYTHLRDNFIFTIIAFVAFNQVPTLVRAQEYNYAPIEFLSPVKATRGTINPISENGYYLTDEDTCHLLTVEMGWTPEGCSGVDKYLFSVNPEIDSIIFKKPNSEGYVKFDDWDKENRDDEIDEIWKLLIESLEGQSERLGEEIKAERWHVYPTLDKDAGVMFYATLINWKGTPTLNITATKFDRKGYASYTIIPVDSSISTDQTVELVHDTLPLYSTQEGQKYTEFVMGDKVAAVGVVGVLATLIGVKYGKGAAAGLLAIILMIAKKAWFLLLIPFVYLKKFFKGKKEND